MKRKGFKIGLVFFLVFTIALVSFISLKVKEDAKAASDDNLLGFAWSSNIGWISVNCENTGSCDSATSNYGVNIDTSFGGPDQANLEGYAWSENIGWINFNPTSGYPQAPSHSVQMDLTTNKITGWARAVNYSSDNSYGWIKFDDYGSGGTYLDSQGKMQGYAWGGGPKKEAVIGWVKTQGTTTAGNGYGIYAKNIKPYVTNATKTAPSHSELCTASKPAGTAAQYELSWRFNDDDDVIDDQMQAYEIRFKNQNDGTIGVYHVSDTADDGKIVKAHPDIMTTEDLSLANLRYGYDYSWKVRVQDSSYETAWSNWKSGPNLDVPWKHPMPAFTYSPDEPRVAKPVTFDGGASEAYKEKDSLSVEDPVLWDWDFGDGEWATSSTPIIEHTYKETGKYTVTLAVTDQYDKTCTTTEKLKVEPKPGKWEEKLPY